MLEPGVRSSNLVLSVFTLSLFKDVLSTALYYTHHLELDTNATVFFFLRHSSLPLSWPQIRSQ